MVLATGCASGTLSDAGDGNIAAILVLLFFMIGSVFGVATYGTSFDKTIFTGTLQPSGSTNVNTSLMSATGSV